jgi:spermidine/putrescine ABC transporter ATP-binding subunit
MTTSVTIESVTKRFGETTAVDDVSIDIAKGEFFTLLGSSGCGKTTLLRIIAGFLRQTSGTVRFGGRPIDDVPAHRRNTGMVFQNYAIFPHLTVFDNIAYGLRARRCGRAEVEQRVNAMLELIRLTHLRDRRPRELSGGQQQRVVLARAMVIQPDVLLMDEPLSNLDTEMRVHLRSEIRALQRQVGITTIYVTHDQEEALLISDRIAVMSSGRVEQIAAPVDIYNAPQTRFVAGFIGESNMLPGRVVDRSGERIVVALGERGRLAVDAAAETGTAHTVAFRPQDADLDPVSGSDGEGLVGALVDIQFLGGTVRYVVDIGAGQSVQVAAQRRTGAEAPTLGGRYRVIVPPQAVRLFEPASP